MHIYNNLKSIVIFILITYIGGQEMLENARCNQYLNRGTCEDRGFTTKWYYDRYAHRCREFHYSGCDGNENRFDSFEECNQACRYEPLDDPSRRCVLPHDPGTCAGNFERWHFDIRIRQCVCSWWSGCGGNSNMFYSYAHCMSICGIYADNRTTATKMTFRRFIPEPKSNQRNETASLREERHYRNLFANSSSDNNRELQRSGLQHGRALPGKRFREFNVRNDQHRGGQLGRRYHYLLQYNPSQHWRVISNRLKQEPRTGYGTRMTVRKRGRVSEASDRVRMSQGRREEVRTNEAQDYGQTEQPRGQSSYLRPQEIPRNSQVMSLNSPIRTSAAPISPERLYAKHIEAYVQQRQAYERARAEALRERERLMQQRRRDEYERAKIYEQELQRYQQAIQSAQNRVLKERINEADVWRQQQQLLPRQYLNSGQGQIATFNRSLPESIRTPEDVRRTKLKHRKLLNFEKLKQIEKNRKILKTTPKPPQHIWWAQQQQQSQTRSENIVQEQQQLQRQNWSDQAKQLERGHQANQRDSEYEREPLHIPHLQHQQAQSYQTSLDSYQVEGQGQRKVITSNVGSMSATSESMKKVSQLIDRPVTELLGISRNSIEPEVDRSAADRSDSEGNWHRGQVQSDAERFPFKMVVAADRVPDHHDVRVAETVSVRPLSAEDSGQEKQMITIDDYEDENYTYDQQTEDEDQGPTLPGHTPAEFAEGRWSLTLAVQPTSSSSTFRSTDTQEMETVTTTAAISERRKESGMETDVIEIISSKQDIKANEGHNMEILEGESENDDGNDEEIMFWQGQR